MGKLDDVSAECNALSERVIGATIAVHRELGPGFHEGTYQRAMVVELSHMGVACKTEVPVTLTYRDTPIGEGRMDLLVESTLVVELKAVNAPADRYARQVSHHLRATGHELGLILNFHADKLTDGLARVVHTQTA